MNIENTKLSLRNSKSLLFENINPLQIILKNSFWIYLSEILYRGVQSLIFIIIARLLTVKEFGSFSYLVSYLGILYLFVDLGVGVLLIRDYQQKEDKILILQNAFSLKLIITLINFLVSIVCFIFAKKVESFLVYFLISLFFALSNIKDFFRSYFIAIQRTEKILIFNFVESFSSLILIFLGLMIFHKILVIGIAYILSLSFSLFIAIKLIGPIWNEVKKLNFKLAKYFIFNGIPLSLLGFLTYLFLNIDQVILGHLRNIEEVAYYSVATRILFSFLLLPSFLSTALFPFLASKVKDKKIPFIFKELTLIFILLGLISSIILIVTSPFLVTFLFGLNYAFSIYILQLYAIVLLFLFPTTFFDYFLISNNKQWLDFFITLFPAILGIVLNFVLISKYGVFGAVYSGIIAQILNFILSFLACFYVLQRNKIMV